MEEPVPALSRDGGLKTLLPPYLHSLLHGDPEQRESAALGIGELVRLSSEATLKPVAIKVAGPLIRVGGDRFGGPVKAAVLEALAALLEVAPKLVKAFVPQLQATFAKALRDPALEVRRNGVTALGVVGAAVDAARRSGHRPVVGRDGGRRARRRRRGVPEGPSSSLRERDGSEAALGREPRRGARRGRGAHEARGPRRVQGGGRIGLLWGVNYVSRLYHGRFKYLGPMTTVPRGLRDIFENSHVGRRL